MKIIISHIVLLNGGDYAILESMSKDEVETVRVFNNFLAVLHEFSKLLFERVMGEHLFSLKPIQYLKDLVII